MSHINKLELLQSKILRTIVNVPWYVRNEDIRKDLKNFNGQRRNRQVRWKIQGKNANTSKQADCWSEQNSHRKKTKREHPTDLIKEIK